LSGSAENQEVSNNQPLAQVDGGVESVGSGQFVTVDRNQLATLQKQLVEMTNTLNDIKRNTRRPSRYERIREYFIGGVIGAFLAVFFGFLLKLL